MSKRKTNPDYMSDGKKRARKGDYIPHGTARRNVPIPPDVYSSVGATRRTRAMAKGILIAITIIVIFCIGVAFATSTEEAGRSG